MKKNTTAFTILIFALYAHSDPGGSQPISGIALKKQATTWVCASKTLFRCGGNCSKHDPLQASGAPTSITINYKDQKIKYCQNAEPEGQECFEGKLIEVRKEDSTFFEKLGGDPAVNLRVQNTNHNFQFSSLSPNYVDVVEGTCTKK